jgi:hypothetical protein
MEKNPSYTPEHYEGSVSAQLQGHPGHGVGAQRRDGPTHLAGPSEGHHGHLAQNTDTS